MDTNTCGMDFVSRHNNKIEKNRKINKNFSGKTDEIHLITLLLQLLYYYVTYCGFWESLRKN